MELILEIIFRNGEKEVLRPLAGEAEKAIRAFKESEPKLEIGTLEGGVEKAVFSTSEIKAVIPRWVEHNNEKTEEGKIGIDFLLGGILGLIFLSSIICLMSYFVKGGVWHLGIGVILLGILFTWFLGGLRRVQQQERWIIEFFGRFHKVLSPGLNWICLGLMKTRAIVPVWEQKLALFKEPIKVDFKDGSATPKESYAFVKVKDPDSPDKEGKTGVYKAIYEIDNWREATVALLENALRSYLNGLTVEEGLEMAQGGYNLLERDRLPAKERDGIEKVLNDWGLKLTRVTIGDFDLDPSLIQAREELFRKEREKDMAFLERKIRAEKTVGALVDMVTTAVGKEEKEKYQYSEKEAKKIARDIIERQMSIDGNALLDIRTGNKGLEGNLLRLIAAYKSIKERTKKEKGN